MTKKINSAQELAALKAKAKAELDLRMGPKEIQITVHMGTCGIAAGAREVLSALMEELSSCKLSNVTLRQSGCLGLCDREPMMTLVDKSGQEYRYGKLNPKKVHHIVQQHVVEGSPVVDDLIRA